MRVLMFGWEFPPEISGGLGTACFGLTKAMSDKGSEIIFVMPKVDPNVRTHVRLVGPESIKITDVSETEETFSHIAKHIECDVNLHPYLDEETYKELLAKVKQSKKNKKVMTKAFNQNFEGGYGASLLSEVVRFATVGKHLAMREQFEIIHAHDWMTFLAAIEAKNISKKPLVVHVHATEFDRCGDNVNQFIYDIEKRGMQEADHVITVSNRTKDMIVHKYGISPYKISVVHNGVEKTPPVFLERSVRPFPNDKIVLFLGRITMQKGPEYFIDAAKRVLDVLPNVRFVMAGSGDMTKKMIEKMASLKLAEKFHFTGFLTEAAREKIFAMSDLYVMPSVSEPFGITPLEAMKYKIPVIISKQSGIAEVLDHVIKVDFWDVDRLASSIINVLTNDDLKRQLSTRSFESFEKIGWEQPADNILEIYRRMTR